MRLWKERGWYVRLRKERGWLYETKEGETMVEGIVLRERVSMKLK